LFKRRPRSAFVKRQEQCPVMGALCGEVGC
jgi:hypothetical protein